MEARQQHHRVRPAELRSDEANGNDVYNLCAAGGASYCIVYLAQLITIQAGVTYEFSVR